MKSAVLEKLADEYRPDPNPERLTGRGGNEVWRFSARRAGTSALRLEYRQPWMTGGQPARTFTVTVVVL